MATCTVTLNCNGTALSEEVRFEPFPNQIINGVAIQCRPVYARANGAAYVGTLVQGAKYRVVSEVVPFNNKVFVVPNSGSADLADLIDGYRAG